MKDLPPFLQTLTTIMYFYTCKVTLQHHIFILFVKMEEKSTKYKSE